MCMYPRDFSIVPEETVRVAKAAFPKGNPCMTLRDELGVIYEDDAFASLFTSTRGRPAESPGCLALVTGLQFVENLSDRQAADAVRSRIDWKYLLGLELTDPGTEIDLQAQPHFLPRFDSWARSTALSTFGPGSEQPSKVGVLIAATTRRKLMSAQLGKPAISRDVSLTTVPSPSPTAPACSDRRPDDGPTPSE